MTLYTSLVRFIWIFLLIFSSAASAQDSFRLTVENFGTREKSKALFDAIGLELEFEEDIVVSPADAFDDVLQTPLNYADASDISSALLESDQDILLRTVFFENDTDAVVLLHRALDGKIIFASRFDVDYAVVDARPAVVNQLLVALRNAALREPTSPDRLRELGISTEGKREVVGEGENDEPNKDESDEKDVDVDEKKRLKPAEDEGKSFGRGRMAFSYAPTFWLYKACNKQSTATYFLCTPTEPVDGPTQAFINGVVGVNLAASYLFLPFLGVDLEASYFRSNVTVSAPPANGTFVPAPFSLQAGEATLALFSRTQLGNTFHIGGRVGGQVQRIFTEDHNFLDAVTELGQDRSVVPASLFWGGLLGVNFGGGFGERLNFDLALDANIASYSEINDQIWDANQNPLALGLSASAQVDLKVVSGLHATAGVRASTFSAKGSGTGTRLSLSGGTPFEDGIAVSTRIIPKVGVAWRF